MLDAGCEWLRAAISVAPGRRTGAKENYRTASLIIFTFGLLRRSEAEPRADAIHAEAMANLAGVAAEIEELAIGELRILAITGGYFAAEKLLDPVFMRGVARHLTPSYSPWACRAAGCCSRPRACRGPPPSPA